jgi:hypothetical protein
MYDKTFVVVGNYMYVSYIECYIRSLNRTNPNIPINVHLINCKDEDISRIQRLSKQVIISTKTKTKYNRPYIMDDLVKMRGYCMNSRIKFLIKVLDKYNRVILMDANTIFRRDMRSHFDILSKYDLYAIRKDKTKTFLCGIFGMRNSDIMKTFLRKWLSDVKELGYYSDNSDQLSFYKIFLQLEKKIKYHSFIHKYRKFNCNPILDVWIGKGNRKNAQLSFNTEIYKYLYNKTNNIDIVLPITNTNIYNLNKCITSIINQQYKDWKLYIMDYGNTDDISEKVYQLLETAILNDNSLENKIMYYKNHKVYERDICNMLLSGQNKGHSNYITTITENIEYDSIFLQNLYNYINNKHYDIVYTTNCNLYTRNSFYNIQKYLNYVSSTVYNNYCDITFMIHRHTIENNKYISLLSTIMKSHKFLLKNVVLNIKKQKHLLIYTNNKNISNKFIVSNNKNMKILQHMISTNVEHIFKIKKLKYKLII